MAIVNLTPDSFSDGGVHFDAQDPNRAVAACLGLLDAGADLLDLGAESTRPGGGVYGEGARTVSAEEEIDRLLPVLEALRAATDAPLSVDTRKGSVARAALVAGADLINDVSALADPDLARALAEPAASDCPVVLMHSRGDLSTMQVDIRFDDAAAEVTAELEAALARAAAAGIARERTIVDPGIGFGKGQRHNLELIGRLDALAVLGRPILLGASRKSFLARLAAKPGAPAAELAKPSERLGGSLAAAAWGALLGAAILRVHDVSETVQFLDAWAAIREARA
jgi:dihydropteroate synthase